jgi:hypothetical protein
MIFGKNCRYVPISGQSGGGSRPFPREAYSPGAPEILFHVPYAWWNYQQRQMMGLFVGAWSGLPIEVACVWIAVPYAAVTVFEVVKVLLAPERSVRETLRGAKQGA